MDFYVVFLYAASFLVFAEQFLVVFAYCIYDSLVY